MQLIMKNVIDKNIIVDNVVVFFFNVSSCATVIWCTRDARYDPYRSFHIRSLTVSEHCLPGYTIANVITRALGIKVSWGHCAMTMLAVTTLAIHWVNCTIDDRMPNRFSTFFISYFFFSLPHRGSYLWSRVHCLESVKVEPSEYKRVLYFLAFARLRVSYNYYLLFISLFIYGQIKSLSRSITQ